MAGSHPTGRATRAADVATPTSPATIPETPSNARVFDVSASICPERPIFAFPDALQERRSPFPSATAALISPNA